MKNLKPLLALLLLFSCTPNNIVKIVKNEKSGYTIITPANSDSLTNKAALILQKYIKQSANTLIPISHDNAGKSIFLNIKPNNNSSDDYIVYKVVNDNLHIEANNSRNLVYAVYDFLENYLNCGFYAPDCEKIPTLKSIELPKNLNSKYSPKITTRTVNSRLFYKNHDFADKRKASHSAFPNYVDKARVHTFNTFVPADVYFDKHPEYFALIDGQRKTTQLCLSNPEVYNIIVKEVGKHFANQTGASVISVSQNDNTQYCRCPQCAKIDKEEGSPAGSMIRFVNKVAKNFPQKTISTLAYQYTRKSCKTKPSKNVLITLCSIECDRSAAINEKCIDFANDLKEWKKLTNNIRIWDYTTQFTNFLAPFPNIYTLKPNIELFANNNARWVFEQHSNNPSELFELRTYLTSRLLWNPNLNTDSVIADFTQAYYEQAGDDIHNYIKLITKKMQEDKNFFLFLYGGPSQAFNSFLSAENLDLYNKLFDDAENKVKDKPTILARVKKARLGVRYASLEACRANLSDKYSLKNSKFVNRELQEFTNTCKQANINWMNETSFSVKNYLDLYKFNLDRAMSNNIALNKSVKLLTKAKKYANENPMALTDGALGGGSFYANWLGFEGNDMIAVIDLEKEEKISNISVNFLQVVNHLVFLPKKVDFYLSSNGKDFVKVTSINNPKPLTRKSKINDAYNFKFTASKIVNARYIKIHAHNMNTPPAWHHGTGLPSWIFADEVIVN